ncbi:relaxase domain-containing protein [Oculatella sp. LEGE 06141]|uniref:MobF family relaxase n=1 Tax=Oculatella sp. LEGE 06141 TaxID=1828648 RepID=UPI001880F44A|nr:MobF family relaxase [Oculatella sp. LEGE 06141]MBE9180235.1 relaxase domain-containing protein [Oculatella sp. LEGE 06141]
MMSKENVSASQAENYYEEDDYYTQSESGAATNSTISSGRWFGTGAIALGLQGEVRSSDFKQLLHGYSPSGQRLHARRIDPKSHRAGTDYTFSAPKSASIAALIQNDLRVWLAHDHAVETALAVLEQRFSQTRVTRNGIRTFDHTGNIVAATFRHYTNREQEPQLHTHCVVINTTQRQTGQWQSMSNEAVFIHQKLIGQIYQNELAFNLQRIGYEIKPLTNGQFELNRYSQEVKDLYSTRRKDIKAYLADVEKALGRPPSAAQREKAALKTRKTKGKACSLDVLYRGWWKALATHNLSLPPLPPIELEPRPDSENYKAIAIIAEAIRHATGQDEAEEEKQNDVFERTQIEQFALEHYFGQHPFGLLQDAIETNPELIQLPSDPEKYITQATLQRESGLHQLLDPVQHATPSTQLYWITPHAKTSKSTTEITIRRDRLRAKRLRISLDPNLGDRIARKLRAALVSTQPAQRSPGETGTTLPTAQQPFSGINLDPNLGSSIGERVAQKLRAALNSDRPDQRSPGEIGAAFPSSAVSSPPTQAPQPIEQPDPLSKEQQDYVNRILPIIQAIWERAKMSSPSPSRITFNGYQIKDSGSNYPELYRWQQHPTGYTGHKILEWSTVGYRGHGLTQKDCEAIEQLYQRSQAQKQQRIVAAQKARSKKRRKQSDLQL